MGKASKKNRQQNKHKSTSNMRRAIKRALTFTLAQPNNNPFPSATAQRLIQVKHEADLLADEIQTLILKIQALRSKLIKHNTRKPRTRQERLIFVLLKYLPGYDPVKRVDVHPDAASRQAYEAALSALSEMQAKRNELRALVNISNEINGVESVNQVDLLIKDLESEARVLDDAIKTHSITSQTQAK